MDVCLSSLNYKGIITIRTPRKGIKREKIQIFTNYNIAYVRNPEFSMKDVIQ